MRKLLLALLTIISLVASAQGPQTTINVPVSAFENRQALLYLPKNYSTAKKYPLLVLGHGAGEAADGGTAGTGVAKLYANSTSNATARVIAEGNWPDSFRVGGTGAWTQFIVLTPQATDWGISGPQFDFIIQSMVSLYAVDTNQIHISGISAGGEGLVDFAIHNGVTPRFKADTYTPMSEAHDQITQANANVAVADSIKAWGFGDPINDIHGEFTQDFINFLNTRLAGTGRFTQYNSGHCCWLQFYEPTYKEVIGGISMNIYEWMLMFTRKSATTPTASSGPNQNINLPTNSVTLNGSGTAGTGHTISTYGWTKISGPTTFTITNPGPSIGAASTNVTNLVQGVYVFRLTVTNNIGVAATSDVTVTVNGTVPVANAGPDQTLTLPNNSTTLDGSGSAGGITSYLWTQLSGPSTAALTGATTVNPAVGSMIAGTYLFQLSVNGGASSDQVQITISSGGAYPSCGSHIRYEAVSNADTGWHASAANGQTAIYKPGDTIAFRNNVRWVYISLEDFVGNPSCPLVIINEGNGTPTLVQNLAGGTGDGHNGTLEINNSSYVKVTGTGSDQAYGFKVEGDPILRYDLGAAIQCIGNSRGVEFEHLFAHNEGTGFWTKNNGDCDPSHNFAAFIMDSISFHDCKIIGTWNEGMYMGNTSPDNRAPGTGPGDYDPRPTTCGDTTYYPVPPRIGHYHIYNNIVDSTGRGGIQMASASGGISEIDHNTVTHNGLNGDDAQGTAISDGAYSRVYIHDNICRNTYTWAIALLGASGTGIPQRTENNTTDSSGYLRTYDLSQTAREFFNPATEPSFPDTLIWPQSFFFDSKPTQFTDSTILWIKNNSFGPHTKGLAQNQQIVIQNDFHTLQLKAGNVICNNVITGTATASPIFVDPTSAGFVFSASCGTPPTAGAGADQNITTSTTTLSGTGTAFGGATISSYNWVKTSGPAATISSPNSQNTGITGMVQGTYVFTLTVTDSNGLTGQDQVIVTVFQGTNIIPHLRGVSRKYILK